MRLVTAVLVLASSTAAGEPARNWVCEAGQCRAGFVLHTFWHDVEGSTTGVTARLESASGDPIADGAVSVSVDAASLVTGIDRRDRKMREEHLETPRHPRIEFRSTSHPARIESAPGGPSVGKSAPGGGADLPGSLQAIEIRGDLTVHGVTRPVAVRVQAERSGEDWIVHGRFTVKLSEFGIPDPSIVLNKVGDEVEAWFEVRLTSEP